MGDRADIFRHIDRAVDREFHEQTWFMIQCSCLCHVDFFVIDFESGVDRSCQQHSMFMCWGLRFAIEDFGGCGLFWLYGDSFKGKRGITFCKHEKVSDDSV